MRCKYPNPIHTRTRTRSVFQYPNPIRPEVEYVYPLDPDLCNVNVDSPNLGFPYLNFLGGYQQGPTGRCFQLRDGSGSGIGKNFGFGYWHCIFINRVLSGIENLDRVFP